MIILGLDCTLDSCAIAISRDGELIAAHGYASKNNHAEILPSMVVEALQSANISPKDIKKIAVTIGPGSFTGVRIGLSFAKSLALSLDIPCIGISGLEVFASSAAKMQTIPIICIAGSVFMAAYENRTIVMPPTRFENFDKLKEFDDSWTLCGQGAARAKEIYPNLSFIDFSPIDPFVLCGIAANLSEELAPPNPLYLRGADVKLWAGYKGNIAPSA